MVPSGSGATHGGFLTGLRLSGIDAPVYGICVRRASDLQTARIQRVCRALANLMEIDPPVAKEDILTWDGALAPGYGRTGETTRQALRRMVQCEGILLDPVYSAKTFAGLLGLLETVISRKGRKSFCCIPAGKPPCLPTDRAFDPGLISCFIAVPCGPVLGSSRTPPDRRETKLRSKKSHRPPQLRTGPSWSR